MKFAKSTVVITRTGGQNSIALDSEVLLVRAFDLQNNQEIELKDFEGDDNRLSNGVYVSRHDSRDNVLIIGSGQTILLESGNLLLSLLRHPYSGIVRIEVDGKIYDFDLYCQNTGILSLHFVTGKLPKVIPCPHDLIQTKCVTPGDTLMMKSLDTQNPQSSGTEIHLLEVRPSLRHYPVFLNDPEFCHLNKQSNLNGHAGHKIPLSVRIMKSESISIEVNSSCPAIKFLRHPFSGKIKLKLGNIESEIDLYSSTTEETVYVADPEAGEFRLYTCTSKTQSTLPIKSSFAQPQTESHSPLQLIDVEESSINFISGWACDLGRADYEPIIDLLYDGVLISRTVANLPRPEIVAQIGIPHTLCGFHIPIPPNLHSLDKLEVRLSGTSLYVLLSDSSLRSLLFATAANHQLANIINNLKA